MAEIIPIKATNGKTVNDNENKGASRAVDKNLRTDAAVEATSEEEAWIKLEFDSEYFIHRVIIYNRFYNDWFTDGLCAQSYYNFKICISNQKNVAVSVLKGEVMQKSCGKLQPTNGQEQADQIYTMICNARGDTVRLKKNSGKFHIWEVVVTGPGESQLDNFRRGSKVPPPCYSLFLGVLGLGIF